MNKMFSGLIGVACVICTTPVLAADSGWYGAVDLGQATYKESDFYVPSGWTSNFDNQKNGCRLLVTYTFDPYWGVEGGYVKFGEAMMTSMNTGQIVPDQGTYLNEQVSANGWQIDGIVSYPFANQWAVFGRLGLIDETVNSSYQTDGFVAAAPPREDKSWKATYGIGFSRFIGGNLDIRLGWDNYLKLGSTSSTGEYNVRLISLGVQYSF